MTLREWRDDGFLVLLWLLLYSVSIGKRPHCMAGRQGFVGQASGSLAGTAQSRWLLKRIQMRRLQPRASTSFARLWRLTCEWETRPRPSRTHRSGPLSVRSLNGSASDGEGGSIPPITTTSTTDDF